MIQRVVDRTTCKRAIRKRYSRLAAAAAVGLLLLFEVPLAHAQTCTRFDGSDLGGFSGSNAISRICPSSAASCQGRQGKDGPSDRFLLLEDDSGASSVTYAGATGLFLGDLSKVCSLSYDVRMFNDNGNLPNVNVPWAPQFTIGNNAGLTAVFIANFTVTEDGGPNPGWFNVRVPTGLSSGGALPTSPDGSWAVFSSGTPSATPAQHWDALIQNVTRINWPTDINSLNSSGGQSSGPFEVFGYDNFCRGECAWQPPTGDAVVKVCKVAGDGVTPNTNFTFSDGINVVEVPAGPAPGGYCKVLGSDYAVGASVVVQEVAPVGYGPGSEGDMSVVPATALVSGSKVVAERKLQVRTVPGVTEVTFTNVRKTGYLEICKEGKYLTGAFSFTISPAGPGGSGPFVVPAGACTPAIEVMAGVVTITEAPRAGTVMTNCRTLPQSRQGQCNATARTSKVTVAPGGVASQTIAFISNRNTGVPTGDGDVGAADSTGVEAPVDISFDAPAEIAISRPTMAGGRPAVIGLACARDADNSLTLCTTKVSSNAGSLPLRGVVKFVADREVIAILPVTPDGVMNLALPSRDAVKELKVYYDEPEEGTVRALSGGSRTHPIAPGAPAPDDNEAARLNSAEADRLRQRAGRQN